MMFCIVDSGFSEGTKLLAWAEFLRAPNSEYLKLRCVLHTQIITYRSCDEYIRENEAIESIRDAKTIYDKALADPVQKSSAVADNFARN